MMALIFKYWRQGFLAVLVVAVWSGWHLAARRGQERDELEARITELSRVIETQKTQTRLIALARKEDQDRYAFKMEQQRKMDRAASGAMDKSLAVRSVYDSLRDRQAGSIQHSR